MLQSLIKPTLENASPAYRILWLIILVLIFGLLFSFIGLVLSALIFGVSLDEMLLLINNLDNQASVSILKFNQLFSSLGLFLFPAIYFAYLTNHSPAKAFQLKTPSHIGWIFLVILIILLAIPMVSFLHELNQKMSFPAFLADVEAYLKEKESLAAEMTKVLLHMNGFWDVLYTLILIAVLPAIGEELLFRGALQNEIKRSMKNIHIAVWLTAAIFSFIHFQFYGFLPRLILGAVLGYIYVYSNNLWLPIIGHFVNNAFGVLWFYLEQNTEFTSDLNETLASSAGIIIILFSAILSICALLFIKLRYPRFKSLTYGT